MAAAGTGNLFPDRILRATTSERRKEKEGKKKTIMQLTVSISL
jgi:hypothetical protein